MADTLEARLAEAIRQRDEAREIADGAYCDPRVWKMQLRISDSQRDEALAKLTKVQESADFWNECAGHNGDEVERLIAKLEIAVEALSEIASSDTHAGQGFCYAPHGTRPCSCHVSDAEEALKKIRGET